VFGAGAANGGFRLLGPMITWLGARQEQRIWGEPEAYLGAAPAAAANAGQCLYERIAGPGCLDRAIQVMACTGTSSALKGDANVTFAPGTSRERGCIQDLGLDFGGEADAHHNGDPPKPAWPRAAEDERRRGVRLLIISALVAAALFAMWWLVATSNSEGHHDAELLPLFTLIPLIPALYHLFRARLLRMKGK
jgi:hypothetical protein